LIPRERADGRALDSPLGEQSAIQYGNDRCRRLPEKR
jgi:hypothetical protein